MSNFIVGLTNTQPSLTSTLLYSYSVCATYQGYPAGGSTVIMECQSSTVAGRYLIVQIPAALQLCVCEVQAFTVKPSELRMLFVNPGIKCK